MFANLRLISKCVLPRHLPFRSHCKANIGSSATSQDDKFPNVVADIDMDVEMYEDSDGELYTPSILTSTDDILPESMPLTIRDINGAPLAPTDIDAWADDDELPSGSVDIDDKEYENAKYVYPPIPEKRNGIFEFKGVKVVLPKKMLKPETYRYRLSPEEQATVADDIRVCKFEK